MTSNERQGAAGQAARRRGEFDRADGDRQLGRVIEARRELGVRQVGRAWLNGGEVGGADPRYTHLSESHD